MFTHVHKCDRGMTLIELLVAVAILMLVFGGVMESFQFTLKVVGSSKAQAGALSLANEEMEYIKSLPYNSVGTVGGIPDGLIPQSSTTTLNGVTYTKRVLVEYVDDPADGTGASDDNGIVADYKLVKVEFDWDYNSEVKTLSLISNVVPPGIETTTGGGTLVVNVFDAKVQPVSGASVRVYNNTGTTTIDTTRFTNAAGIAMFSGAPALAGYEITVTKSGYSTDGTYTATTSNPNPTTQPVAVLESQVSTMNFQIDTLSDLTIKTLNPAVVSTFSDPFDDSSNVGTSTNISVSGGEALLSGAPGSFSASGTIYSTTVTPGTLKTWNTLSYQGTIPASTTALVHVYRKVGTTTYALIPDSDLPNNAAGFAPGNVDLRALSASTYPSLVIGADLSSSDVATSSTITAWSLSYTTSQTSIANIPFTLTGAKVIGATASSAPVYKYKQSMSTDATGVKSLTNLEWDTYSVALGDPSYDISEACNSIPYILNPGVTDTLSLTLVAASANSLRVNVVDTNGQPIPNATITLSRTGFNSILTSSACGQAFFNSGVSSANDYALTVQAAGYIDQNLTGVLVSGASAQTVTMAGS